MLKYSFILCLFLATGLLFGQTEPKAEKHENPEWFRIDYVDFHPGMADKANGIIDEFFVKASKKAGTALPAMNFQTYSGDNDLIIIWKMQDGIEELNWKLSPDNLKWWNAMMEICGGNDEAEAKMQEYYACVRNSRGDLVRLAPLD